MCYLLFTLSPIHISFFTFFLSLPLDVSDIKVRPILVASRSCFAIQ